MFYIIPGYLIAFILMFFCPDIFVAMGFDSGGTASGPMSVSFVVPMMIGIVSQKTGSKSGIFFYERAFGLVSMIALVPIIAIEILGIISYYKNKRLKQIQPVEKQKVKFVKEENSK